MSHASRMEACKNHLKRINAQRIKARIKRNQDLLEMTPEEVEALNKPEKKTVAQKLSLMKWDYNLGQLAMSKHRLFMELIVLRLKEVKIYSVEFVELEKLLKEVKRE